MGWVMGNLFLLGVALKLKGLNTPVITKEEHNLEILRQSSLK